MCGVSACVCVCVSISGGIITDSNSKQGKPMMKMVKSRESVIKLFKDIDVVV